MECGGMWVAGEPRELPRAEDGARRTWLRDGLVLSLVTALDPAVQRATCQGPRHCPHRLTAGICISRERMRWGVGMHPDAVGP